MQVIENCSHYLSEVRTHFQDIKNCGTNIEPLIDKIHGQPPTLHTQYGT